MAISRLKKESCWVVAYYSLSIRNDCTLLLLLPYTQTVDVFNGERERILMDGNEKLFFPFRHQLLHILFYYENKKLSMTCDKLKIIFHLNAQCLCIIRYSCLQMMMMFDILEAWIKMKQPAGISCIHENNFWASYS